MNTTSPCRLPEWASSCPHIWKFMGCWRLEFFAQVNMAKYPNNNMDFMIWKVDLRNKTSELGKIVQQTIFHIVDM